ncbi:MAG: VWA domain-containing protein, partial [Cyanobacteria bacterium J06638_38]
ENKNNFPEKIDKSAPRSESLRDRPEEISTNDIPDTTDTTNAELTESPAVSLENEPVQVVKAVRSRKQGNSLIRPRYSLLNDYFPVTKRQMKQSWRYLRRLVREGVPTELDVEATVAKTVRQGILLETVLMPPRINRTDLVLLIDREGSMVPFHNLSRQLLDTATRGGRLKQTRVFYFHDYVDEYVYQHPALIDAQHLDEMLAEAGERAAILIISDAGAARGSFDKIRVERTQIWIEQLQKSAKYVAWLNPMPSDSWQYTTAEEISQMLPMFAMSRTGMNAAISVLRGRYVTGEVSNG